MDASAALNLTHPWKEDQAPPATSLGGAKPDDASAPSGSGLMKQWNDWLSQEGNQAALISAGLQMMQPIGVGQSVLGHVARAIGKGGEAKQAVQQTKVEQGLTKAQTDYYASGGSRGGGLTQGQILAEDDRKRRLYGKALMDVWSSLGLGGDMTDPVGAMLEMRTKDPQKYNEIMQAVNVLYQQYLTGPEQATLGTQVPTAPGAVRIARNAQGQEVQYDPTTKKWVPRKK